MRARSATATVNQQQQHDDFWKQKKATHEMHPAEEWGDPLSSESIVEAAQEQSRLRKRTRSSPPDSSIGLYSAGPANGYREPNGHFHGRASPAAFSHSTLAVPKETFRC